MAAHSMDGPENSPSSADSTTGELGAGRPARPAEYQWARPDRDHPETSVRTARVDGAVDNSNIIVGDYNVVNKGPDIEDVERSVGTILDSHDDRKLLPFLPERYRKRLQRCRSLWRAVRVVAPIAAAVAFLL